FSSRGPTDDGRIKPDVVAPGTWILSGFSELYQEGYGDPVNPQNGVYQYDGWGMPYSQEYKYMGGTSMSNPLTAGAAAVVRDYYQKADSHNASAALVKATLINSAVDLLDENNDGVNDNDFPIPNIHEGWGRVNVASATDGSHDYADNTSGVSTSNTVSYDVNVAGGGALKVSLVWSDYPSTETASVNLVNDLDLVITGPGGSPTYRGNVFSGGWSQTGGSADRINNVENVYIQSAGAGTWTVDIVGFNVPQGAQPFALVVDGGSLVVPPPPSSMHVGDLDSSTATGRGGKWDATITITVHDESEAPVSGATVSGSWSAGASGSGSCVTNGSGQCSITKSNISKNSSSVTFTVSNVTHATLVYNSGANHDPDGDSNGTSIVVLKP
ncbi:MAG: S8 family serine peptidase, partial [Anaerolineales bacterium]|nr:S8 family serine peptidase [Anaerolineales bacterium]